MENMCRVLRVSPSGYYAWWGRGPSETEIEDARLIDRIRSIYEASRGVYGVRRIHRQLRADGERCSVNRIAHQARHSVARDSLAIHKQLAVNAPHTIDSACCVVDTSDLVDESSVVDLALARTSARPGVVAAHRHFQHTASVLHVELFRVVPKEAVSHWDCLAKNAVAFFSMSRSSRRTLFSRRSRISSSWHRS